MLYTTKIPHRATVRTQGYVICLLFLAFALGGGCTPQYLLHEKEGMTLNDASLRDSIPLYEHTLQPDDKLTISVWGHEELGVGSAFSVYSSNVESGKYLSLSNQGEISLPLVGPLRLEGLTTREADLYLKQLYSKFIYNPIIEVRVVSHKVTVLGEVEEPGNYTIQEERRSVLEAIADAGGFSDYADIRKVKVLRRDTHGHQEDFYLDLSDKETAYNQDLVLRDKDIVYVPPRRAKEVDRVNSTLVTLVGIAGGAAVLVSLVVK